MGITKNKITSGNSGAIKGDGTYLKKGGKVGKKKMMTGGMNNPNAKAAVKPSMKKGGSSYKYGGKKGM